MPETPSWTPDEAALLAWAEALLYELAMAADPPLDPATVRDAIAEVLALGRADLLRRRQDHDPADA
jgi:hypothetical protein